MVLFFLMKKQMLRFGMDNPVKAHPSLIRQQTMKTKPTLAARLMLCLVALLLGAASVQANNLTISNVSLTGQDTVNDFILVQFDITWKNSWRISGDDPDNYDAVWVFVKYRVAGDPWMHATLNFVDGTAANDGHIEPSGATITTPVDGKGVFIYRSADDTGTFTLMEVQLRWNYGVDGLPDNGRTWRCRSSASRWSTCQRGNSPPAVVVQKWKPST